MRGKVFQGHLTSTSLSGVGNSATYQQASPGKNRAGEASPGKNLFYGSSFWILLSQNVHSRVSHDPMCPEEGADFSFEEINRWNKRTKPEYKTTFRVKKIFLHYQKGRYPIQPSFQCKTLHRYGVATQPVAPDGCIELGRDDETVSFTSSAILQRVPKRSNCFLSSDTGNRISSAVVCFTLPSVCPRGH